MRAALSLVVLIGLTVVAANHCYACDFTHMRPFAYQFGAEDVECDGAGCAAFVDAHSITAEACAASGTDMRSVSCDKIFSYPAFDGNLTVARIDCDCDVHNHVTDCRAHIVVDKRRPPLTVYIVVLAIIITGFVSVLDVSLSTTLLELVCMLIGARFLYNNHPYERGRH